MVAIMAAIRTTPMVAPIPQFCVVAVGDQDERQHAQQGDGAAVGHLKNFDVRQHGAQGDHQGALHESAGLGIGFGHGIHSSKNVT